jgi:hypothetical protein
METNKGTRIQMKKTLKLGLIAVLMAMAVSQTNAATDKTIWVQKLNVSLTAWTDGNAKASRVTTKDIVTGLSGFEGVDVTNPVFSAGSQLLIKQDTTVGDSQVFVVRDPKTHVDTDVSSFFDVGSSASVSFTAGSKTVRHSITTFIFSGPANVSFNVSGLTTETRGTANGADVTKSAKATVSGTGTVSTTDAVMGGTISLSGGKLEAPLIL